MPWFQVDYHFSEVSPLDEVRVEISKSVRVAHAVQMSHFYSRLVNIFCSDSSILHKLTCTALNFFGIDVV